MVQEPPTLELPADVALDRGAHGSQAPVAAQGPFEGQMNHKVGAMTWI